MKLVARKLLASQWSGIGRICGILQGAQSLSEPITKAEFKWIQGISLAKRK